MRTTLRGRAVIAAVSVLISCAVAAAQAGNSGSINGTVTDPTGAVVPNADVEIRNPISGLDRSTKTDSLGKFGFTNIPFNPYHLTI